MCRWQEEKAGLPRAAETLQWARGTKGRGSSISREVTEGGRLFVLLRQTSADTVESHCERRDERKHGNGAVYIGFLNKRQRGFFYYCFIAPRRGSRRHGGWKDFQTGWIYLTPLREASIKMYVRRITSNFHRMSRNRSKFYI